MNTEIFNLLDDCNVRELIEIKSHIDDLIANLKERDRLAKLLKRN